MAMIKKLFLLVVLAAFVAGCATLPKTTRTGAIHELKIEETLSNANLNVQIGDEIRWVNYRTGSATIEFTPETVHSFGCIDGFADAFGRPKAFTSLRAGESASLCFSKSGVYKYNVRMTASVPGGEIIVPAVIEVVVTQ
jgi:plastocyanin